MVSCYVKPSCITLKCQANLDLDYQYLCGSAGGEHITVAKASRKRSCDGSLQCRRPLRRTMEEVVTEISSYAFPL